MTRSSPHDRYCLTSQVRALSDGFAEDDWISAIAAPVMSELTHQLVWPVALMTFEAGRMLVRETTHEASTLSIDHGMVGRSLPLLRTASGRCYLALCRPKERRAILDMLSRSRGSGGPRRTRDAALDEVAGCDPRQGLRDPGSRDQSEDDRYRGAHSSGNARTRKLVVDLDFIRADDRTVRKSKFLPHADNGREPHRGRGARSRAGGRSVPKPECSMHESVRQPEHDARK